MVLGWLGSFWDALDWSWQDQGCFGWSQAPRGDPGLPQNTMAINHSELIVDGLVLILVSSGLVEPCLMCVLFVTRMGPNGCG